MLGRVAKAMVRGLANFIARVDGTEATTDRTGLTFNSLQSEANFWYNFVCKQLPPDHWLQPGRTGGNRA